MKKAVVLLSVVLLLLGFCLIAYSAPVFGDVNSDGSITADDARTVLRASVGLTQLSDEEKIFADMNRDGRITADDARTILRISVGLEDAILVSDYRYNYRFSGKHALFHVVSLTILIFDCGSILWIRLCAHP